MREVHGNIRNSDMNKTIVMDKVFSIYTKLPHCLILRGKHIRDVRGRFDRENLADISIISTNCAGGEICYLLDIGFRTPFVNISMSRREYIELVSHLREYMELPLTVTHNAAGSCTGVLKGDGLETVTISFPHDSDPETVVRTWERRKARINYEKLVLLADDRGLEEEDFQKFDRVPAFRKLCLTAADRSADYSWCFQLKEYAGEKEVGKYNDKSADGLWKFTKIWDYVSWLNGALQS